MKSRFFLEADGWSIEGNKINEPHKIEAVRSYLENEGVIIIEHWFYRGACAPERVFIEEFEDFMNYLNNSSYAGDKIYVWGFSAVCKDDNSLAVGKCPDDEGRVPQKGAY